MNNDLVFAKSSQHHSYKQVISTGLIMAALALSLSGCQNLQPQPPIANADIPNSYDHSIQGNSIASQGYQQFLADPRLVQVIELALSHNRDLRSASLNIQRAQQYYQISKNDQFPMIAGRAELLRQVSPTLDPNNPSSSVQVGLGLTAYELDFWGRVRNLKEAALDRYLATQSARDAMQISLISQVSQAWLDYAFSNAQLKLAQQTLAAQLNAYQLNQKRFNAGTDSEIPLRQAQISVETARHDAANSQTQLAQAQNLLNLLVGQPLPVHLLPQQPVQNISSTTVLSTGLSSDLLNNRPDLKLTEYQLHEAGANIAVAKAALFPSIRLTGSAGYASTQLSDLFKSGHAVWSIGPSLDLPIFDWGTRQANLKISKIEQQIALSNYEKSIQSAFREVNDSLATRAYMDERISAQRRLVNATQTTYRLSNTRFRAGIDSYLSVLDAQRAHYAAEQSLLMLEQARLNNQIELYKVLGGGLAQQ
ncbi:AdeC/AdeK/OprM family multidrug efflux complex outer membrane factor [Acinetobacter gyllenbergii]|uniref:AdeC/AdeK/OprM family multidrug efflux complex outer membrane factor n=1 Tax=Acinetobacter gyllenbergii TaxID=134534 RepID=UPI0009D76BC1|nr:AdeC/AdeK/OprM family multidrug efflux complex outer membrane factor [Acinetobacter gyllenbergii]